MVVLVKPCDKDTTQPIPDTEVQTIQGEDKEASASCLSRWIFGYMSPLVRLAAKNKRLEIQDCWRHGTPPAELYSQFDTRWQEELKKPKPSLVRTLWGMSRKDFIFGAICWGIAQILQVCQPIFLQQVVRFVEVYALYGQGEQCRAEAMPVDRHLCNPTSAMIIPLLFVLCIAVQSLLMQRATQTNLHMALQFRTITTSGIIRKSLRLSSIGAGSSSAGQISNLVSNDAQQIVQFAPLMHMAWTSPIFVIMSLAMLAYAVGPSFLAALAVLLIILPLIIFAMKKSIGYRGRMVKSTDDRVKLVNDVLLGMRVIKAYGWEEALLAKIGDMRRTELRWNSKRAAWTSILITSVFTTPVLNALAIFTVYAVIGGEFVASRIFMALATLNALRFALVMGPFLLIQWANFKIATDRMQSFLLLDELPQEVLDRPCAAAFRSGGTKVVEVGQIRCAMEPVAAAWAVPDPAPAKGKGKGRGKGRGCLTCCLGKRPAAVEGGNGSSNAEEKNGEGKNIVTLKKGPKEARLTQVLFDLQFQAEPGLLTAVVGGVGSGKSSLLHCLLGEMEVLSGAVHLRGTVAYVAQQAFILNTTVKQNITLIPGDLSPEQEEFLGKVLQACALQDDLAMLTGGLLAEIGERGITLSGGQKQRISLARACFSGAEIVLLDDPLSAVDAHVGNHLMQHVIGDSGLLAGKTRIFATHQLQCLENCHCIYMLKDGRVEHTGNFATLTSQGHLKVDQTTHQGGQDVEEEGDTADIPTRRDSKKDGELVMDEEREEGELQMRVVRAYVKAGGLRLFCVWLCALLLQVSAQLCTESWLAAWSSGEGMGVRREDDRPLEFWIGIYFGLGMMQGVFLLLRNLMLLVYHTIRASQTLHDRMIFSVLRGKMLFFDRNPLGRILNRFTRDLEYIDVVLVQSISQFVNTLSGALAALLMICIIYPFFSVVALVMMLIYHYITRFFRNAARELQRLESVTRSPIFSLLSESQGGVSTIRGYGVRHHIVAMADKAIDLNTGIILLTQSCGSWLQLRLDLLALMLLLAVVLLPVLKPDIIGPGYAGLAITYAFEVNMLMKHTARMSAEVEQKFNSVDRVLEYSTRIEHEPAWACTKDSTLPTVWPSAGHVVFSDVVMSYRPGLQPALRGISFEVSGGEKVGICGRTGSGKSSLIVALLRMTEYTGSIEVDGINLQELGLHAVRQKISMIPQDPVLFCTSLRGNLDPFGIAKGDDELQKALGLVLLSEEVEKLGGLDFAVAEGGKNFSVGQRQLLCLARAALRSSRLVLLDEATASVDHHTDELIQQTIRVEFKSSTVMTIAHRLNTILDSDKILVLEEGEVAESGAPRGLASNKNSRFHKLLQSAGCTDFLQQAQV